MTFTKNELQLNQNISKICKEKYKYFLNKKNVIGVGCGYKIKRGFKTFNLCIQVFVIKKILKFKLNSKDIIPSYFKGIKTDVIEIGEVTTCSLTSKIRPVIGGYGVSSINYKTYGTAGCLVTNGISNFLLSTNHAIAGENEFIIGTPITQPGYSFGGKHPIDTIGTLNKFIPLRFIEGEHEPVNLTDCALGLLKESNILTPKIAFIGKLNGVKKAILNDIGKKVGASTEYTEGRITTVNGTILIRVDRNRQCLFQDIITTTAMMSMGDSGCILVNRYNYGIGLGFGGNNAISIFCNLYTVLDQLDVHLVT